LAALFEFECKVRGAQRTAYPCVVASGINNNILHYVINDQIIRYCLYFVTNDELKNNDINNINN